LPNPAAVGATVTVTGTLFGSTQGSSTVAFNGVVGSVSSWSQNAITVVVPTGATTGDVVVTVNGQPSNGFLFMVPVSCSH
jgi:ribosomal protein L21E